MTAETSPQLKACFCSPIISDKKSRKSSLARASPRVPALVWRFCDLFPEAIGLETVKKVDKSASSQSPASAAQVSLLLTTAVSGNNS